MCFGIKRTFFNRKTCLLCLMAMSHVFANRVDSVKREKRFEPFRGVCEPGFSSFVDSSTTRTALFRLSGQPAYSQEYYRIHNLFLRLHTQTNAAYVITTFFSLTLNILLKTFLLPHYNIQ